MCREIVTNLLLDTYTRDDAVVSVYYVPCGIADCFLQLIAAPEPTVRGQYLYTNTAGSYKLQFRPCDRCE